MTASPYHCLGYVNEGEEKITLSLDVTPKEYRQLKDGEIFFALQIDDVGENLDVEKFTSDDYPD